MKRKPRGISIFGATTYRIEYITADWILIEESRGGLLRGCKVGLIKGQRKSGK